jgi:hypothetical protein
MERRSSPLVPAVPAVPAIPAALVVEVPPLIAGDPATKHFGFGSLLAAQSSHEVIDRLAALGFGEAVRSVVPPVFRGAITTVAIAHRNFRFLKKPASLFRHRKGALRSEDLGDQGLRLLGIIHRQFLLFDLFPELGIQAAPSIRARPGRFGPHPARR